MKDMNTNSVKVGMTLIVLAMLAGAFVSGSQLGEYRARATATPTQTESVTEYANGCLRQLDEFGGLPELAPWYNPESRHVEAGMASKALKARLTTVVGAMLVQAIEDETQADRLATSMSLGD
jgi:hypothetical protein